MAAIQPIGFLEVSGLPNQVSQPRRVAFSAVCAVMIRFASPEISGPTPGRPATVVDNRIA